MALAMRLANERLLLMKLNMLKNVLVPMNIIHTSAVLEKQRNPFSLAEAGMLKAGKKPVTRKRDPSTVRLTGTNDVSYRKNLPRVFHTWETGVAYLNSKTYHSTYGDDPVWVHYRRNHAGQWLLFTPKPRDSCFTKDHKFELNNACPLCRDEYLVVHYKNTDLLKQFLDCNTGELMEIKKLGLCKMQHDDLRAHILLAREHGYLTFDVPFRNYDYRHYYASIENESDEEAIQEQHVVAVNDKPEKLPDKREYAYIKYPTHMPLTISIYDI